MANQSSAQVTITVNGPVKEFLAYAKAVSNPAYYTLIDEHALENPFIEKRPDGREVATIGGYAEGRWAYSNNLESYFAPLHSKDNWRSDSKEAQITYGKLVGAIRRDKKAFVRVEYTDMESGAGFLDIGSLELDRDNILETPHVDSNSLDLTIENLKNELGYDDYDALVEIYGDEVASGWDEYQDLGGQLSVEEFVDEYSSDIYDGKYIGDILDLEAAEPEYDEYVKKGGEFSLEDFAQEYGKYLRAGEFDLKVWLEKEKVERDEREAREK